MQCYDYDWATDDISEWHELWFVGDQHYGAAGCAVDRMIENVAEIKERPRARVALMGDCCDFVNFTDKRFDLTQVAASWQPHLDDLPRFGSNEFIKIYEPIKDKIICLIPGNHDETIRRRYHFDVAGYIAGVLGVPILGTVSQIRLRLHSPIPGHSDRAFVVKGVLSHAEKGSATLGGKVSATAKIFDFFGDHDFIAQAHMHEYLVHEGINLDVWGSFGSPKIHERHRMLFLTGGYLKTYNEGPGGYGEKRAYRPCMLGSPRLEMRLQRTHQTDVNGKHKRDKVALRGF